MQSCPDDPSAELLPGHGHSYSPHAQLSALRQASSRLLWIAMGILATLFFVELIGGIWTNSLALISDAAHLLTDVAAVGLALFAQWFARKPPSARRSFGYHRVEILAALANGFTLVLVAVYIGVEAYKRMTHPPEVLGWPMVIVASVGLVAQIAAAAVLGRARGESLNVRSAYIHALTDAIQSVGVIAAGVLMLLYAWYIVDPVVSLVIGILVAVSGTKIILEATHVLIEGTPAEVDLGRIAALIEEVPGVVQVTDLHAWTLTTGYNALSAHVLATPAAAAGGNEALLRRITQQLCTSFPLHHVTLQIEQDCAMCQTANCNEWMDPPGGDRGERSG